MSVNIYDRLGRTIRRSRNLRGVLEHYRKHPDDMTVKVRPLPEHHYKVTFYWPSRGESGESIWADWRVLLDWLAARKSWSINRVTFDAPLYDSIMVEDPDAFEAFRKKTCVYLTRHAYQN